MCFPPRGYGRLLMLVSVALGLVASAGSAQAMLVPGEWRPTPSVVPRAPTPTTITIPNHPTPPPPTPKNVPEPTTLLTGLLGSGLAGIVALRRRARKKAEETDEGPAEEADEVG